MMRHIFILMVLIIVAIAGWAYNVNYKTMTALDEVSALRGQIAKERESLQVLKVEWAYLNAPDRLARLVEQHNDALRLVPMTPDHLKHAAAIPFGSNDPEDQYFEPVQARIGFPIPAARPADWRPND